MRQSFVHLTHESGVVGVTEVSVVVSTELVVAIDHVSNTTHHPLNAVKRTHTVSITVHHGDRGVRDILDGDVSSHAMLLSLHVRLRVLLETTFNTHLEEVSKRASRNRLLSPDSLLIAPLTTEMSTHLRLKLLPVQTVKSVKSNHVNLVDHITVVMVAHGATKDVHLGARGEQNGSSQVVLVEVLFVVSKPVE